MLIGIDASRAVARQPTGTEHYSQELIAALIALDSPHRFRLYFNRPPSDFLLSSSAVESRVIAFPRLWTHLRLSWEMATRPPDLLFVPAHVLPLVHPYRSVVTVHDLGYLYFPQAHRLFDRWYLDLSTRWNARAAAHLLADSEATKHDLVTRYGVASTKVTVVYPGYDAERFRPASSEAIAAIRARYGLPADYVLFVGTIQPRKNIDRLLEAMARLEQPVPLVVAGRRGWLFEPILRRGEELDLRDRVMFLDYVAADDLPALMSGARCFVLPALHEGFGFPVVEAMACGTPVVCSNTTSLMEVAGDAALLIDPLDVAALAEAIARVLRDDELRAKMRQKGLARTQRFSWDRCARETMTVLERVGRT